MSEPSVCGYCGYMFSDEGPCKCGGMFGRLKIEQTAVRLARLEALVDDAASLISDHAPDSDDFRLWRQQWEELKSES